MLNTKIGFISTYKWERKHLLTLLEKSKSESDHPFLAQNIYD